MADAGDLRQRPEPASDLRFVDFDAGVGFPGVLVPVPTVDHHDGDYRANPKSRLVHLSMAAPKNREGNFRV